jgi:hypothetical protein
VCTRPLPVTVAAVLLALLSLANVLTPLMPLAEGAGRSSFTYSSC